MNSENILTIKNLSFEYDSGFSLKNINVDFIKGEKIAVLGSNGSGKSTFFLNINGVLSRHHGNIFYKDININGKNLDILRRNVGIVFQEPDSQLIASTVEAEVSFGPINMGLEEEEVKQRVDSSMIEMNIEFLRERPVHYLSGGQKKRVSIADILAMRPEIIIFDEPTASLDPINCEMFERTLQRLENQEVTTIVSTHDVNFAWKWAERIIVFDDGCIIADDIPQNVFADSDLLRKANLVKPMLMEVYEILADKGFITSGKSVKSISELKEMFL